MRVLCCLLVSGVCLAAGTVVAAEPKDAGDSSPESTFQVTGQVVDEDGRGLPGVNVESIFPGDEALAWTDNSGRFVLKLPRKPREALLLRVVEAGGSLQAFAGFLLDNGAAYLDVEPGVPDEVELVVRPAQRIDVRVVDENQQPVADAQVLVGATWFQKLAEARTDAAGDATLLVPAGAPLSSIVAMKPGAGLDYFLYQSPRVPKRDPYRLPRDHAEPLTFVLDGVHQVTVNVVDENGQPLPGARVRASGIEKPRKGGNRASNDLREIGGLVTSGFDDFNRFTDRDGKVTLDYLPPDCVRPSSVDAWMQGYRSEWAAIDPGSTTTQVTATLWRVVPFRGRVSFSDGRPAARARVWTIAMPLDPRGRSGNTAAFTDERGFFEAWAYPNSVQFVNARLDRWAAPPAVSVVLDESPKDEVRIVLANATRVYGRVTVGPEGRPLGNEHVIVLRNAQDEDRKLDKYRELHGINPAPEPAAAPRRGREDSHVKMLYFRSESTGEQGEFEFFLPPGRYELRHQNDTALEFELAGEAERELKLHLEHPSHEELTGRVVAGDDAQQPLGEVSVIAYYVSGPAGLYHIETTADANGAFRFSRQRFDMVLYARSEDGLLAGTVRVGADETSAAVRLRPAARAHGRLLDAATGEALRNTEVIYEAKWDRPSTGLECGGSVRTDELGEFTAIGLLPGRPYWLQAITGEHGRDSLTNITPDDATLIELGDFKIHPTGRAAGQAAAAAPTRRTDARPKRAATAVRTQSGDVQPKQPDNKSDPQADGKPPASAFQVTGRVVDEDGRPVAGAEVDALGNKKGPAVTDGEGRFALQLPEKPPHALLVRATHSAGAREAYGLFFPDKKQGLPADVTLVLRPAREIVVNVVDGQNRPMSGAQVTIDGYSRIAAATTDETGRVFLRLPADAPLYAVVAMKPGVGIDYFLYQSPDAPKSDPYHLPRDRSEPLTLVLDGVRRVTVKAVDEGGQPIPGVSVYPWLFEKPKKGGELNTSGLQDFRATTDQQGQVTFDMLPADCAEQITFWVSAEGYYSPERTTLVPGTEDAEITATLFRLLCVRGQVTFDDGRPATGATVISSGRGYYGHDQFHAKVRTDDEGRFELGVYREQFYAFAATLGKWTTPLVTRVVRNEAPADELKLVLGKTTRVFGRLTVGRDHRPYAGQPVAFHRRAEQEYEELPAGEKLPKIDNRPISPIVGSSATTGEQGEFEFLAGPGECEVMLVSSSGPVERFILSDESEYEVNLHVDRPREETFAGRVVLARQPEQVVAEARVGGFSLDANDIGPTIEATTGADGSFAVVRRPLKMLIYARSEDGSLAGVVRVGPDDHSAVIRIAAAASAHGRLLDATTGQPLRNMEVTYGMYRGGPGRECGGSVRTDENGEFTALGLLPGVECVLVAVRDQVPERGLGPGHLAQLTVTTPRDSGRIELGDFELDPMGREDARATSRRVAPGGAAQAKNQTPIYDTRADGNAQIAAALKIAGAQRKHVLLQFGANWCEWCHRLSDCFRENADVAAALGKNYVLVLIDVDVVDGTKHNADIIARYGNPTRHGLPVLVVLDADGKLLTTQDTDELEQDDHHDPAKVLRFLNRWKPK